MVKGKEAGGAGQSPSFQATPKQCLRSALCSKPPDHRGWCDKRRRSEVPEIDCAAGAGAVAPAPAGAVEPAGEAAGAAEQKRGRGRPRKHPQQPPNEPAPAAGDRSVHGGCIAAQA